MKLEQQEAVLQRIEQCGLSYDKTFLHKVIDKKKANNAKRQESKTSNTPKTPKPPKAPKKPKPYVGAPQKPSPTTPTRGPKHKKSAKKAPRAGSLKRIKLDASQNTELQKFIMIRGDMRQPMTRSGVHLFRKGYYRLFELP